MLLPYTCRVNYSTVGYPIPAVISINSMVRKNGTVISISEIIAASNWNDALASVNPIGMLIKLAVTLV